MWNVVISMPTIIMLVLFMKCSHFMDTFSFSCLGDMSRGLAIHLCTGALDLGVVLQMYLGVGLEAPETQLFCAFWPVVVVSDGFHHR